MQRIIYTMGLLMLCYLWHNSSTWYISINTDNIISKYFVKTVEVIPNIIINIFVIILIIIYISNIISGYNEVTIHWLTLIITSLAMGIATNILCLQEVTNLFLCKVNHPIPIDMKLHHFFATFLDVVNLNKPELLTNKESLQNLAQYISNISHEKNTSGVDIGQLNAREIYDLAVKKAKNYLEALNQQPMKQLPPQLPVILVLVAFLYAGFFCLTF